MKIIKIFTLVAIFLFNIAEAGQNTLENTPKTPKGFALYLAPISLADYITDPVQVIKGAKDKIKGWEVQEEEPGRIRLILDNYRNYQVILDVLYTDKEISFSPVSDKKIKCRSKKASNCHVGNSTYDSWMSNLRRHMLGQIQELAIIDATKAI